MAQFGVGPEFSAQCPRVDVPDGWRYWADADGPIPDALLTRAKAIAADTSIPLGSTESFPLPGVTALIRTEPHPWRRDEAGALVQGCFHAAGVYLPSGALSEDIEPPETSGPSKMEKAVVALTAVSLVVGIGATLWGRG